MSLNQHEGSDTYVSGVNEFKIKGKITSASIKQDSRLREQDLGRYFPLHPDDSLYLLQYCQYMLLILSYFMTLIGTFKQKLKHMLLKGG